MPTSPGFWAAWVPFALPQVWPFCWWVGVAIDHCSRRVMGFAVYRGQPSSRTVRGFLERLFREVGHQPRHLVSDQGRQFVAREFRRWCRRRGTRQRFGAIGQYGSLAVIERCIRTLKTECTGRLIGVQPPGLRASNPALDGHVALRARPPAPSSAGSRESNSTSTSVTSAGAGTCRS